MAVAEKLSAMQVATYFPERARRANIAEALALLDRLGTAPPRPGDELDPNSSGPGEREGPRVSSRKTKPRTRSPTI